MPPIRKGTPPADVWPGRDVRCERCRALAWGNLTALAGWLFSSVQTGARPCRHQLCFGHSLPAPSWAGSEPHGAAASTSTCPGSKRATPPECPARAARDRKVDSFGYPTPNPTLNPVELLRKRDSKLTAEIHGQACGSLGHALACAIPHKVKQGGLRANI